MNRPKTSSLIKGALIFALLLIITIYMLHRQFDLGEVSMSMKSASFIWLIPAAAAIIVFFVCEGVNIGRSLRLSGCKISIGELLNYALSGFFFSSITPSASGGQPMQLYFMHRNGISFAKGSLALLAELMSFQAAGAFLAITGVCLGVLSDIESTAIILLMIAGILINSVILLFICFTVFSPTAVKGFAAAVSFLINKFFSSKSARLRFKFFRGLAEYRRASSLMRRSPVTLFKMFLTSVIQLLCYFSITWLVCRSFGIADNRWINLTLMNAVLFASVSALPLPGAVGITEGGFSLLFQTVISPKLLGSVLVLVRLINFGLPLAISGLSLINAMSRRGNQNNAV